MLRIRLYYLCSEGANVYAHGCYVEDKVVLCMLRWCYCLGGAMLRISL